MSVTADVLMFCRFSVVRAAQSLNMDCMNLAFPAFRVDTSSEESSPQPANRACMSVTSEVFRPPRLTVVSAV